MSKNILSNFPEEDKNERGIRDYIPVIAFAIACLLAMLALFWRVSQIPDELETFEMMGEPIKTDIVETKSFPEELTVDRVEEPAETIRVAMTDDDALAAVAMSEAGNQDVLGMAFVVMTVLNRCDYYNMTVDEVLYAPNQYAYPYYGEVSRDAYRAVELAREYRDSFDYIMWFRTGTFHNIGDPAFKWGDHYFSKPKENNND